MEMRHQHTVILLFILLSKAYGQSVEAAGGLSLHERIEGSGSSLGLVTKMDTSLVYDMGSHFSVAGGIPVYFVRPSDSSAVNAGAQSAQGIGNVYARLGFTYAGSVVSYSSTLTATAPTGKQELGFSTGHATVDWSNYLEKAFSPFAIFGEAGLANAVSDTLFFVRPYVSQGFVVHGQAGIRRQLSNKVSIGGSLYAIRPSGQQTVYSRVSTGAGNPLIGASNPSMGAANPSMGSSHSSPGAMGQGNGKGQANRPVFESSAATTGTAGIARDDGVSAWLKISPASRLDFYAGFTHSREFAINTGFFGIEVTLFGRTR